MEPESNRREHPRLNLGEAFTVRFEVEGRVFRGVVMTNLSVGGVGLRMEVGDLAGITAGTLLRNLVMEHPALPSLRIQAEVRHVLGAHPGRASGPVFLGVQFQAVPEALARQLEEFIQKRLGT